MAVGARIADAGWLRAKPADWRDDRLKDIVPRIVGGGTPSSSDPDYWEGGDVVWVTPTDFSRNGDKAEISDSERKITRAGLRSSAATLLPRNTVIMASRATIGAVRLAGTELATNQGFISFVCDERRLHHRFLYYVISGFLGEYFAETAPGTTFSEISRGKAKLEPIAFPALQEQERIAAFLDASCAAIDAAVAAKRRQIDTLDGLLKTTMHAAVTRGISRNTELRDSQLKWLGQLPTTWKLSAIKRIVSTKITDGPHETPDLVDEGVQFISAEAIKNGRINFALRRGYITQQLHETYCRKCKPQRWDIFVVKSGATTGNVAYVDVDFEFSIWSPLALIRCDERLAHWKFVYYVLSTDVFRKQIELAWSFGTQQNIGMRVIERVLIPIPPIEEQRGIAAFLDAQTAKISSIRSPIESQIDTLIAYRKSLIHECVTGQKRVTEADLKRAQAHG
jgi:type I restriction enzyme S subunit